jgi:hypothetical protein
MNSNVFVLFVNIKESNIHLDKLRKYLSNYNLTEETYITGYDKKPEFIWFRHINEFDQKIQNYYYSINCFAISRLLNINCICDKYELYVNMKKYFPNTYSDFMPKSLKLENNTPFISNSVFIARPVNEIKTNARCHSGTGILVYDSEKTLHETKKKMLNKYDKVIVSEYIKNPLLFKKKKMHLRCHMFVTIINNVYEGYLYDSYKVLTALKEYNTYDFQNKDVHDSHSRKDYRDYLFPNDFTSENTDYLITEKIIEKIYNDIREISKKMVLILKDKAKCPKNAKNAFHLFGFDVLIDENLKVYLLECNRFCDITSGNPEICNFDFDRFFNWVNDIILTPLFDKNKTINIKPSFINTSLLD